MSIFNRMRSCVTQLHKDESGQGLVEYVLVVALLVLTAITAMQGVATQLQAVLGRIATALENALGT